MSTLKINKPTPRPSRLTPEQACAEFEDWAPFFENQRPDLRFLSTGFADLDFALSGDFGGAGLPSSLVTHWRAPHAPASDALLLRLCRAGCERGERVCLVDAANRFDAAALQAAGLDAFAARGLFKRFHLNTLSEVAHLADAWRRGEAEGEAEGAPSLLVVDALVAAVGARLGNKRRSNKRPRRHKASASPSRSFYSNTSHTPEFDPRAHRQGQMFFRLLCKLDAFARSCGAGMIVAELPVESMRMRPRYRSKRRRNDYLEYAAHDALAEIARVELVLETNSVVTDVARVHVAPNCFAREGGFALLAVNARSNAKL